MGKILITVLTLTLLTGCMGMKKRQAPGQDEYIDIPSRNGEESQAMSLPGVPLKYMPPKAREKALPPQKALPEETPAPAPVEALPVQNTPKAEEELQFHLGAAKRYYSKKYYKSAAAEYGAALSFTPSGDTRTIYFMERQGAMLLRAGSYPEAGELFRGAIQKAKELNNSGKDLANSHLGLGYCLEQQGKIPEAIENYETAEKLSTSKANKARLAKTIKGLKAANPSPK
jgi:tetratricopeptide (TPR) repeat protein